MKDVHSGFVCNSITYPFIGASPDGNIQCECCTRIGVLEVKCPYCVRDGASAPYIQDDGNLLKTHMYYYQVQTQLFADYADFVVATFRDGNASISIQRIFRDEHLIKDIVDKSSHFLNYVFFQNCWQNGILENKLCQHKLQQLQLLLILILISTARKTRAVRWLDVTMMIVRMVNGSTSHALN